MPAAVYHWSVDQGSLAEFTFQIRNEDGDPINTTGLSGRGQIRTAPGGILVGDLTVTVVNHSSGLWRVACLPATIAGYDFGVRTGASDRVMCHYDVELYDALDVTNVTRWLQGQCRISVECTK